MKTRMRGETFLEKGPPPAPPFQKLSIYWRLPSAAARGFNPDVGATAAFSLFVVPHRGMGLRMQGVQPRGATTP